MIHSSSVTMRRLSIAPWKFRKRINICWLAVAAMVMFGHLVQPTAQAEFPSVRLQTINSGELMGPVGMTNAGDGSNRLFVVDQRGKVQILQDGSLLPTPFLDIESSLVPHRVNEFEVDGEIFTELAFDERGLLGLAFHPNFGVSGQAGEDKFYVYYSQTSPNAPGTGASPVDHRSVVAEYSVSGTDANVADAASERVLMTFDQPQFNHDGGQIAFGPDGYLYIGTGDGGSSNDNNAGHTGGDNTRPSGILGNSQDRTNLLGNILRIDVDGDDGPNGEYGIPTGAGGNPFVGEGNGVREEIFAYGVRNPWRFSFDDGPGGTGRLFIADVGQGEVEEINVTDPASEQGVNFGWRVREGSFDFDNTTPIADGLTLTDPVAEYIHPGSDTTQFPGLLQIGRSVTGGFVYRGSEFPELEGQYIFADWSTDFGFGAGTLLGLEEVNPDQWELSVLDVLGGNPIDFYINGFGEDESGELYVVGRTNLIPGNLGVGGVPGGIILKIVPVPEPSSLACILLGSVIAACGRMRRRTSVS